MLEEKNKDSDYSVTLITLPKNSLFHNNLWEILKTVIAKIHKNVCEPMFWHVEIHPHISFCKSDID